MKTIVITGAAGFIGSNLSNYLYRLGHSLVLIDSLEYGGDIMRLCEGLRSKLIIDNLQSMDTMNFVENADIVIHLAGISSLPLNEKDPVNSVRNNFISTVNIYEIAVKFGVSQFYFASTSAVYENNNVKPFKEDIETCPDLLYSYSKKISEDYLQLRTVKKDGINTTVLRFFNVFGSGQNTLRLNPPLTGYLVDKMLRKETATLYNRTSIKRDYIHVRDVQNIILKLFDLRINRGSKFELFNLCSGNSYSVPDIIRILEEVSGEKLNLVYADPADIWNNHNTIFSKVSHDRIEKEVHKESIGSNAKLKEFMGNQIYFTNMREGLEQMYNQR